MDKDYEQEMTDLKQCSRANNPALLSRLLCYN